MDRFEGFADAQARFFKALKKAQKGEPAAAREWFNAHKAEFEEGWNAPMKSLLAEVRDAVDKAYPHCDLGEPKVFRIFRDVRFAKDKSPYKTHIGGYIPTKPGASAENAPFALYFHVGDDEVFGAAGHYMMDGPALAKYRTAVADAKRGGELGRAIAKLEKKGFTTGAHDALQRVPKGFDPEHPRAELLKQKGLYARFPRFDAKLLTSRALIPALAKSVKEVAPLVEWLVFATA
jgi:uncharacterized protein (TIGR02453 family)